VKMRINRAQEFVIGGFIPDHTASIRSSLVTIAAGIWSTSPECEMDCAATRRLVYKTLKPLVTDKCPFVNLPQIGRARWGEILDAEKMKKCVWVRPKLVAVIEFLEWTEGDRLRHSKFVALRDDKAPLDVVKEA